MTKVDLFKRVEWNTPLESMVANGVFNYMDGWCLW